MSRKESFQRRGNLIIKKLITSEIKGYQRFFQPELLLQKITKPNWKRCDLVNTRDTGQQVLEDFSDLLHNDITKTCQNSKIFDLISACGDYFEVKTFEVLEENQILNSFNPTQEFAKQLNSQLEIVREQLGDHEK